MPEIAEFPPAPLTQRGAVAHLRARGLITPEAIVRGGLRVSEASRRNRNFKVTTRTGAGYILKQGADPEAVQTVRNEAFTYRAFAPSDIANAGVRYLPVFVEYDDREKVLILELLQKSETLLEHHSRTKRFSNRVAAKLGEALAWVHGVSPRGADGGDPLKLEPAWVLSIHRPYLDDYCRFASGNLEVVRMVQRFPDFEKHLDRLRSQWTAKALIHSDFKWDNCILARSRRRIDLRIVDWEMAGIGDPAWDVGSVFSEYLTFWLQSIPVTHQMPLEGLLGLARHPLSRMQPAMQSFWKAYIGSLGLSPVACRERLILAAQYSAARLIQSAIESSQASVRVTANLICYLQVSLNILRRPVEAAVLLLGIPCRE